jgi:NAD(P)H-dependent FMN reductase/ketosteroid isomerase-like protein
LLVLRNRFFNGDEMTQTSRARVGVLVGSLRRGSYSRKIADALIARAPAPLACHIIEIGKLPLYNEDLDPKPPREWTAFREQLRACDALLFVTPEYNRSIPGCLKNATDIGSRPQGENVFDALPAAIVSVSPYRTGAFGANHALRQNFVYLNLRVMQQPEAYIGEVAGLLGKDGAVTNSKTDKILCSFMAAFDKWIAIARSPSAETFDAFMKRREAISGDYIGGDAAPLLAICAPDDPATFFPPNGKHISGADAVRKANKEGAKAFTGESRGRFEVLQSGSSGEFAFWTGIQHAKVAMVGKDKPVVMKLRTTEVFRLENGEWKLVHRHADFGGKGP